ncbi:MAG: ABC transporter permease [Candidatus Babeliaceae bacterium]|jgi:ABC-2 type transport system permease protein
MEWYRISAIVLRHLMQIPRDFGKLSNIFYWPLIDLVIFGFTSVWLKNIGVMTAELETVVIAGIVLWQIIVRVNLEISGSMLEEIWSHNMNNLFASPVTLAEWMSSSVVLAFVMTIFVVGYVGCFAWLVNSFVLFNLGWVLVPLIISLFASGLAMGFLAAAILVYYGARIQTLVYMMGFLFMPLSGVTYSLDILPMIMQKIALCLPMAYTFKMLRVFVIDGTIVWTFFAQAMILNSIYLVAALYFFRYMFEKSRAKGLARLVD